MKRWMILLCMTVLLLGACGKEPDPVPVSEITPGMETTEPAEDNDPSEMMTAVRVSELLCQEGEYTDGVGNIGHYRFRLPHLEGQGSYIAKVNDEIAALNVKYIADAQKAMQEGYSLWVRRVDYYFAEYQGITSILICVDTDEESSYYYVWNINAKGEAAENSEIFSALGISGEQFTAAAKARMREQVDYSGVTDIPEGMQEWLTEVQVKTLSEENCNADLPIFVSAEGTICFVGRIYSVAGADYYDHLLVIPPESGFGDEELLRLAQAHILASEGYCPQYAALEEQEDGIVAIQLYDNVDGHNSTADWYTVSRETGKGSNLMEYPIDLTLR